jgi:hypothetical protein
MDRSNDPAIMIPTPYTALQLFQWLPDPPGYYVVSCESNTEATLLQDLETDPHYAY